ncbi:uncharacterized protein BJ212DRAFT_1302721 [Suillus subaureus]|uniref:KOW domain-containing protein n=1 Tax=Suillus subaureus TaxID=48587 RepID=A0A9P7E1W7_9AGAM|nr:uncharacterized protein BJ212DRAFT_1302721 [Suillus subaureus]KAG1809158.1 hypothetical protein BJ212DRAFT_1302721 [Suillus subaureus]
MTLRTLRHVLDINPHCDNGMRSQASYEECEAVECACPKLPNPGWVRITQGKYKGDIDYAYDSKQSNNFVAVLIPPQDFPYPTVSDILHDGEVIGCLYKGEQYYMGLLLKRFWQDGLEIVVTPHPDYIRLHLQSGWNTHFVKATELAFSMQFLCIGDEARVITGEDVECMFWLGLEGHIIQMCNDVFHLCQELTKEEVKVSKYYLDCHPLMHALQSQLPTQQLSLVMIEVPLAWVQWMYLTPTIKYTKDKGYDVRPGDFVKVIHGPEHQMTGVIHSIDFPTACLTLLSQTDKSLINIPIRFMVKMHNASLDTFKNIIGKEVFIIRGELHHIFLQ